MYGTSHGLTPARNEIRCWEMQSNVHRSISLDNSLLWSEWTVLNMGKANQKPDLWEAQQKHTFSGYQWANQQTPCMHTKETGWKTTTTLQSYYINLLYSSSLIDFILSTIPAQDVVRREHDSHRSYQRHAKNICITWLKQRLIKWALFLPPYARTRWHLINLSSFTSK